MTYKTTFNITAIAAALLLTSACKTSSLPAQSDAEISACMRTVLKLDEGRWNYMGTIGRLNGTFRTYETTSIHAAAGEDMWSSKSFGGDVGGTEADAEIGYIKMVGTTLVPLEDGVLNREGAIQYKSCVGPDPEGRYEAHIEYKISHDDMSDSVKSVSWFSKHGSYYAEDHTNEQGQVVARRSGVYTPVEE